MKKTWYVTGISRGFGKTLAVELLNQGCFVVGTTRSGESDLKHDRLRTLKLDVTQPEEVKSSLSEARRLLERIDVVVNNAGFGIIGAIEEVNLEEAKRVFETNLFGTLNVTQAALPYLRQQQSGHIVNFSSVSGFKGRAGMGIYNATKFAVEGFSEALAEEVKPFGIAVTIVEPGAFRTDFLTGHSLLRASRVIEAYRESSGKIREWADQLQGHQPGDPVLAMKVLIQAVNSPEPSLRLPLGADAIEQMKKKLEEVGADIRRWEGLSLTTGFEQEPSEKCVA